MATPNEVMGKYTIREHNAPDDWAIMNGNNYVMIVNGESRAMLTAELFNRETKALQAELATTQAALEAASASLTEARSFIREIVEWDDSGTYAGNPYEIMWRRWGNAGRHMMKQWDSAVAATTPGAELPKLKFIVRDKVRIVSFAYMPGSHETISAAYVGKLNNLYRLEGNSFEWNENQLEVYTEESESQ